MPRLTVVATAARTGGSNSRNSRNSRSTGWSGAQGSRQAGPLQGGSGLSSQLMRRASKEQPLDPRVPTFMMLQ